MQMLGSRSLSGSGDSGGDGAITLGNQEIQLRSSGANQLHGTENERKNNFTKCFWPLSDSRSLGGMIVSSAFCSLWLS